jgi:hypothetical protein
VAIALSTGSIAVRTAARRLLVFTLRGRLVQSYPLRGIGSAAGPWIEDGYTAYIRANKALRAIKLSTGRDQVIVMAGSGWFWNGASFEPDGLTVPQASQHGKAFTNCFRVRRYECSP